MRQKLKTPYHKEPPGGWHMVRDGIAFRGIGPDEVIERVREYLLANGKPPGNIMGELVKYCAIHWPHLVTIDYDDPMPVHSDPLERVMTVNAQIARRPLVKEPEPSDTAERIFTCTGCFLNIRMVGSLYEEVTKTSFLLTKGRLCKLGYCKAHGWDNRVAVRWDKELLKPMAAEKPAQCWL